MPLPGRRQRLPDQADATQSEVRVQFVAGPLERYNFRQMRHMTMKPIFSLMGIACAQLA
jgi:hypothetical protein